MRPIGVIPLLTPLSFQNASFLCFHDGMLLYFPRDALDEGDERKFYSSENCVSLISLLKLFSLLRSAELPRSQARCAG